MPIEIKELHIRVSVNPPAGGPPAGERTPPGGPAMANDEAKEALVAECVEMVLEILNNKMER
jgi:hypothetical protein